MSALNTFITWYAELQGAVRDALEGPLQDGLKQEIRQQAKVRVYDAYSGGGVRRGQIGDQSNLDGKVSGYSLRIRNITQPQGYGATETETGFVESGSKSYRQPFPRPFMDEALFNYANGQAPEDLANYLRSKGFEVN